MNQTYTVTGVLPDGRTIRLDEPLPIVACKVRVTVEVIEVVSLQNLPEFLGRIHGERTDAGVQPLLAETIDEWVEGIRDGRGG